MATLTCAALTAIYYSAESLYADGQKKADYVAEVNAAKAVIENTTAKINVLDVNNKVREAKIYWNKKTTTTINDCADTPDTLCALTGDESDADCKTYVIEECTSAGFVVDDALYAGSNLNANEVFADNMLKTMKALDEAIAQKIIAKIDSFSSPNLHTTVGVGCPGAVGPDNWAQTYIQPTYWTPEVMAYFLQVARINKFASPFLLDGDNLYTPYFRAINEAGNANGAGAKAMIEKIKYYEDMVNMAVVNGSTRKTFMVERGTTAFSSYALWAKNGMTNPLNHGAGQFKFSVPSKNIPGLVYDVYTKDECSGAYEKHTVRIQANYDVFNGPAAVNGSTGVLEFVCGNCPS